MIKGRQCEHTRRADAVMLCLDLFGPLVPCLCSPLHLSVFSLSISGTCVSSSEDHPGAIGVPLPTSSEIWKGLDAYLFVGSREAIADGCRPWKPSFLALSQDELWGVTYPPQFLRRIRRKLPSLKTWPEFALLFDLFFPVLLPIFLPGSSAAHLFKITCSWMLISRSVCFRGAQPKIGGMSRIHLPTKHRGPFQTEGRRSLRPF